MSTLSTMESCTCLCAAAGANAQLQLALLQVLFALGSCQSSVRLMVQGLSVILVKFQI